MADGQNPTGITTGTPRGEHGESNLHFRGRVEYGFASGEKEHVVSQLTPLATTDVAGRRPPVACQRRLRGPVATAEIRYLEITSSVVTPRSAPPVRSRPAL
jgi:hypothetical protein